MGLGASRAADFRLSAPPAGVTEKSPLVLTLGWYGAQDRHLAKYAALLNKEGYRVLRGTMPGSAVFSPWAWPRRRYAAALLDQVREMDPAGQRPLVLYAFSNGGAFVVEQLDCLLASEPRYSQMREQFRGCVFDSAPCYMSPLVGAAAIGHGMPAPLRLLAALAFLLSMLLMMPFAPRRPWAYWCRMRELRLGRRRVQGQGALYLYSADDPLCLADKLDALIAARRAAGADADAVRWEASQHVAHLMRHPRRYRQALLGFLAGLQE